MLVVADTTPLNYLILIDCAHVLPRLYRDVVAPSAVVQELQHPDAPDVVKRWLAAPPAWLRTQDPSAPIEIEGLGRGEVAAIAVAVELCADRLLMDEQKGRAIAVQRFGLRVAGTLAILRDAAIAGELDLAAAIARLRSTTFRADDRLYQQVLDSMKHG